MVSEARLSKKIIVVLLVLKCVRIVRAHSFLLKPLPYDKRTKDTSRCRGESCINACPLLITKSRTSPESPSETWRRGQSVRITWARNNHHGGFAAFSLVPVSHMHNSSVHWFLTILHSCWESNIYNCARSEYCGSDSARQAYSTRTTVPLVYPDGIYVFRYVWYGGLHFKRQHGFFPEYKSCSFIRIRGGPRSSVAYKPEFVSGTGPRIYDGQCESSADAIGQCSNIACFKNKKMIGIPKRFRSGSRNLSFKERDILKLMREKREEDDHLDHGDTSSIFPDRICAANACCPIKCGRCGGIDCQHLPGGPHNCCTISIKNSKRRCSVAAPPCVLDRKSKKKYQ